MKLKLFFLSLFSLIISITVFANSKLAYNLVPGQTMYYSVEIDGQSYLAGWRIPAQIKYELHFIVKELKNNTYKMQLEFDRMCYKDSVVNFDSNYGLPAFGTLPTYFSYLVGKPVYFELSKSGELVSVDGLNTIIDSIVVKFYKKSFIEKMAVRQFINNELINTVIAVIFPQYSKTNSESWEVPLFKKTQVYVRYTSKNINNKQTIIFGACSKKIVESLFVNNGQFKIGSIESKENFKVDPLTGILVDGNINNKFYLIAKEAGSLSIDSSIIIVKQQKASQLHNRATIYGTIRGFNKPIPISNFQNGESELFTDFNPDFMIFNFDTTTSSYGKFSISKKLNRPVEIVLGSPYRIGYPIFIEPGDSICINADYYNWENTFELSGKGSFKNNLIYKITNRKCKNNIDTVISNNCLNNYLKSNDKISALELLSDSLSIKAKNYIKTTAIILQNTSSPSFWQNELEFKITKNNTIFENFLNDVNNSNCSFYSRNFRKKFYKRLKNELGLSAKDASSKMYYYGKYLMTNSEPRYYVMANGVYNVFRRLKVNEAKELLSDFKNTYPESELANKLESIIVQKVDLSPGSFAPDFELPNVEGKKISLSKFNDKWVLLFINSDNLEISLDEEVKATKKIRESVQKEKFEAVWIMTGKNKENLDTLVLKCSPLGTVLLCRNWEDKQFSKYRDDWSFQWHLLSPGLKIEGNIGMILDDNLINQLIETINHQEKPKVTSYITKKALIWAFCILLIIILLTTIVYKRRIKQIRKKEAMIREKLDLELRAIRSQLNPHFMFNSLSSIQHLVNTSHTNEAIRYLSNFSGLMRKVLQHSDKELIPLTNELETIREYLELEALRFRFSFSIDVESQVDIHTTELPPLILQPFVENAVLL